MAVGKQSDFVIYDEQFWAGAYELVTQNADAFNAASANAIQYVTESKIGDYEKQSFIKDISSAVSRRDMTSVSAVTDLAIEQGELIAVKLHRKFGPIAQALGALKKIGSSSEEISFILGQQYGKKKMKDMLNSALISVEAALEGQSNLVYDATGQSTTTMTHGHLASGLAKMGDAAERVVCWVMHSKVFWNLVGQAISDKITNVADMAIYQGTVGTFNRPVIVTDSSALTDANGSATDTYNTLGLVQGGVVVTESEEEEMVSEIVTGLEQLALRIQGEFGYNLGCKGFKWDVTNGGANPQAADLGTTTNWDKAATDDKDLAGIRIVTE